MADRARDMMGMNGLLVVISMAVVAVENDVRTVRKTDRERLVGWKMGD